MKSKKGDILVFAPLRSRGSRLRGKRACPLFGFSLLEVILALAILAGALAALGEVMRLGDENASAAADETRAEMLAESVMSELLVGARVLGAVSGQTLPIEDDPPWTVSIAVQPTDYQELVAVQVSVMQQLEPAQQPARCDIIRWLPNPDYIPATTEDSSQQSTSSSTGGSSSSGTQGSSGAPQ